MNIYIRLGLFDFYQPQNFPSRFFFLIILISATSAIVTSLQRSTDKRILWKNFVEEQNQREKSSRLISCAMPFIEEYFEYSDQISLLVSDLLDDASALIKPLMTKLPVSGTVYSLSYVEPTDELETYDVSKNIVILSKSAITLEKNYTYFANYCKRECSFVIMLTNLFADEESFLIEAGEIIEQMSLHYIFKLAILALIEESVLLAGSIPIRIGESYMFAEPALQGRCQWQSSTAIRWQRFEKSSPINASVNAAIYIRFPYAYLIGDKNNLRFGGIEGSMVEEIASNMNLKLNRSVITWQQNITTNTQMYLRFKNTIDDLIFGGRLWNSSEKIDFMTSYGMVQVVWLIPMKTNVSFRGLITPFSANVWYAIISTLFLSGLVKHFLIHDISFLDMAALVLGVSTNRPDNISSKILFISYSLFGFFLTQLYLGSLADQLQSASDSQIETMEELVKSGLQIGGTRQLAQLLETPDKINKIEKTIRENLIVFPQQDYTDLFSDIIDGSNTSLALLVMLNLTDIQSMSKLENAHIMKENVGSYPLAIATWQGFPYLKEFNFKIQMLVQTGLVQFWTNMAALNTSYITMNDSKDDNYIDIDDLAPAFLLLIIGYFGGFCLMIIEVILYPSKLLL
ncbi:uncharacterized protein LOC126850261 [Cataglyphis hispanica]|uniref:uncharacterized protein LOC126850261 n=1 Tax=Cataglyphis hispanica TaxID=1086592 RepID=UPI00217F84ED|nr:uncharacterized protein LOC126850261 [Cataglyphis hispanica]